MADYTTVALVKAQLRITDTDLDTLIQKAVSAASRWIDGACETTFYPVTEARLFEANPCSREVIVDKFVDTAGLIVKTGPYGSYTTTIPATDYVLHPLNAPSKPGGAYYKIVTPNRGWPSVSGYSYVEVTASWGWPAVPDDIAEAALILASQVFRRMDSPEALAGALEDTIAAAGAEDPTVALLLRNYREIGAT